VQCWHYGFIEEANIAQILQAMLSQRLHMVEISENIVVASGCTDRTEEIAREFSAAYPFIKLYVQPKREGKTSAVKCFFETRLRKICVVESGDTVPHEDCYREYGAHVCRPGRGYDRRAQGAGKYAGTHCGLPVHLRLKMEHQLCLEIPDWAN